MMLIRCSKKAQTVSKYGKYVIISYTRFADDLTVFVSNWRNQQHWVDKLIIRLTEEFDKLGVKINKQKSSVINFDQGNPVDFLGYTFRLLSSRKKNSTKKFVHAHPQKKKRTKFLQSISDTLRHSRHIPVDIVIKERINPKVRGWVNYFRWGHSGEDLKYVAWQVEMKIRKFASRQRPISSRGGRSC